MLIVNASAKTISCKAEKETIDLRNENETLDSLDEKGFDFESRNLNTNFLANLYAEKRPIDILTLNQEIKNFNQ